MDKVYELMIERLNNKKSELKERQESFSVMCHNEMDSGCFERNAISDLNIMQQLKSEISELEHWKLLMEMHRKSGESK